MPGPGDDGVEDGAGAVDDGEFVVAGGQSPPLFEVTKAPLNNVACLVVFGVEGRWASAG